MEAKYKLIVLVKADSEMEAIEVLVHAGNVDKISIKSVGRLEE